MTDTEKAPPPPPPTSEKPEPREIREGYKPQTPGGVPFREVK